MPCIRILGERHTGTRAVEAMLNALPHIRTDPRIRPDRAKRPVLKLMKKAAEYESQFRKLGGNAPHQRHLDARFMAKPRAGCWKHARLTWDDSFTALSGVILTMRNPYSWLIAMYSRPLHRFGQNAADLSEFLALPWLTLGRELMAEAVASPVDLWVEKARAALAFEQAATIPVARLGLESLLADPVGALGGALAALGQDATGLAPLDRHTKTDEPLAAVQQRHADNAWRKWLRADQVAAINARLDESLLAEWGYALEDPNDYPDQLSAEGAAALQDYLSDGGRRRRSVTSD